MNDELDMKNFHLQFNFVCWSIFDLCASANKSSSKTKSVCSCSTNIDLHFNTLSKWRVRESKELTRHTTNNTKWTFEWDLSSWGKVFRFRFHKKSKIKSFKTLWEILIWEWFVLLERKRHWLSVVVKRAWNWDTRWIIALGCSSL
jgi:hypothetical protein